MIRKLKEKDAIGMLEWMHDSTVNCWFRFDFSKMTEENVLDFIKNSFNEENQNFAIINENDEYMGTISLKNISRNDGNAEYAIVTRKDAQGTGIAFEATKEIIRYAFEELELHRVYLNVLEINERANNFYKKCGFIFEGISKEHLFLNNQYQTLNWYAIVKEN